MRKHDFTPIRKFNLMFQNGYGGDGGFVQHTATCGETAQAFCNLCQCAAHHFGASCPSACVRWQGFRNEITPGNFTFPHAGIRQMECEFFCKPGTDLEWFAYWKDYCKNWLLSLGIKEENLRCATTRPQSWPSIQRYHGY